MKKLKVFSVILLITSIGAFVAFQGYTRMIQDKKPPVVSCDSSELKVSVKAKEKDLLKGVTAKDNRSGDVSDTLVVENMSEFTDKGKRTVTYAAVDKSMNVGRAERTLVYEDYKPPVFHMTGSLCYAAGETVDVSSKITADSVLDGDLTSNIKYSLEKTVNTQAAGESLEKKRTAGLTGKKDRFRTDADGGRCVHRNLHQLGGREGTPVLAYRRHCRQE